MKMEYAVDLSKVPKDEGGGILVTFPDFPEGLTHGDNEAEALANASDCLDTLVAFYLAERKPLPTPGEGKNTVTCSFMLSAKAALWQSMQQQQVTQNNLAKSLNQTSTLQVSRMLDPKHKTSLKILDQALRVLGKEYRLEIVDRV